MYINGGEVDILGTLRRSRRTFTFNCTGLTGESSLDLWMKERIKPWFSTVLINWREFLGTSSF
jgi:hypothetical protein